MIPKKGKTRTGRVQLGQVPTHYTDPKTGEKKEIPASLIHNDKLGDNNSRQTYLAGTDPKTGLTGEDVWNALEGETDIHNRTN